MKVGDKINSDHQSVQIWIKGDEEVKREGNRKKWMEGCMG